MEKEMRTLARQNKANGSRLVEIEYKPEWFNGARECGFQWTSKLSCLPKDIKKIYSMIHIPIDYFN